MMTFRRLLVNSLHPGGVGELANTASIVQALNAINTSLQQQTALIQRIADAVTSGMPTPSQPPPPIVVEG